MPEATRLNIPSQLESLGIFAQASRMRLSTKQEQLLGIFAFRLVKRCPIVEHESLDTNISEFIKSPFRDLVCQTPPLSCYTIRRSISSLTGWIGCLGVREMALVQWEQGEHKGRVYYYNKETKISQWEDSIEIQITPFRTPILTNSSTPSAVTKFFKKPSNQHLFSTATISANGITGVINSERRQCQCCSQYFRNKAECKDHRSHFKSRCVLHNKCFPSTDNVGHAIKYDHDRCFISRCTSQYRNVGDWSRHQVTDHIAREHDG